MQLGRHERPARLDRGPYRSVMTRRMRISSLTNGTSSNRHGRASRSRSTSATRRRSRRRASSRAARAPSTTSASRSPSAMFRASWPIDRSRVLSTILDRTHRTIAGVFFLSSFLPSFCALSPQHRTPARRAPSRHLARPSAFDETRDVVLTRANQHTRRPLRRRVARPVSSASGIDLAKSRVRVTVQDDNTFMGDTDIGTWASDLLGTYLLPPGVQRANCKPMDFAANAHEMCVVAHTHITRRYHTHNERAHEMCVVSSRAAHTPTHDIRRHDTRRTVAARPQARRASSRL